MAELQLLLDGLVALGTLGLAGVTFYQARLLVRERKSTRLRELAQRVLTPLRGTVERWASLDHLLGETGRHTVGELAEQREKSWPTIRAREAHLLPNLPTGLISLLEEGSTLEDRIVRLKSRVASSAYEEFNSRVQDIMGRLGVKTQGWPQLYAVSDRSLMMSGNLVDLWLTGQSATDWAREVVAAQFPGENPKPAIRSADQQVGGPEEAGEATRNVFLYLESDPLANELRQLVKRILAAGRQALDQIDGMIAETAQA